MLNKFYKSAILLGLSTFLVTGCQNNSSETKEYYVIKYTDLYEMNDEDALVEVDGKKLSIGNAKQKVFDQQVSMLAQQFVEKELLFQEYGVTEQELNDEISRQRKILAEREGEEYANKYDFDEEELKLNIVRKKALSDGLTFDIVDLKKIYEQNFKDSGKTFEELKPELEEMAPYYLGNDMNQVLSKLYKKHKVKFGQENLKEELERTVFLKDELTK